MARQRVYEMLAGQGQGQSVRVLIVVDGEDGDFTELSALTRREIVAGLVADVARSASTFGVPLVPTNEYLTDALENF